MNSEPSIIYLDADSGLPSSPYHLDASKGISCPHANNLFNLVVTLIQSGFPGIRAIPAANQTNGQFLTIFESDMQSPEGRLVWLYTLRAKIGLKVPPPEVSLALLERAYELTNEALPPTYTKIRKS